MDKLSPIAPFLNTFLTPKKPRFPQIVFKHFNFYMLYGQWYPYSSLYNVKVKNHIVKSNDLD